jgi:Sulfotransferase family
MTQPAEQAVPEERSRRSGAAGIDAAAHAAGASDADAAERTAGRMPDFFIIGHIKCGTTALYKMLRGHPQIFMPDFKEPRFFSSDHRAATGAESGGGRPQTLEAYLELFAEARPDQLAGEASPQYIRSPTAAARIAELQPGARLIAILREPASFLRSVHLQFVQSGIETERDLRTALALEDERRQGRSLPHGGSSPGWLLYSDHVRYVEQLRRLREHFPSEQVLVLIYDDYRRDNEGTLRTVLRFLGVDEGAAVAPIETRRERLTAVRFMGLHPISRKLRMAKNNPERAGRVARTVSSLAPGPAQRLWRRVVYTTPPPPEEAVTLELRRRFKPEVQALSEYLGRDLVGLWGYDKL